MGGRIAITAYAAMCYRCETERIWVVGEVLDRFTVPAHGPGDVSDDYGDLEVSIYSKVLIRLHDSGVEVAYCAM